MNDTPKRRLIITLEDTGRPLLPELHVRTRRVLKLLLRSFGLRAVSVEFDPQNIEAGLERVWDETEKQ